MDTKEFSIYGGMISGFSEQGNNLYRKYKGLKSTWFVGINDPANHIYYAPPPGSNSQGFGGATLTFKLEDGTEESVQGPWNSNSDSFLADTGVDFTDQHMTQGIVSLEHEYPKDIREKDVYKSVIHFDEVPAIGTFNRVMDIAQNYANEHNCRVYYAVKSRGGGSAGSVESNVKPN